MSENLKLFAVLTVTSFIIILWFKASLPAWNARSWLKRFELVKEFVERAHVTPHNYDFITDELLGLSNDIESHRPGNKEKLDELIRKFHKKYYNYHDPRS